MNFYLATERLLTLECHGLKFDIVCLLVYDSKFSRQFHYIDNRAPYFSPAVFVVFSCITETVICGSICSLLHIEPSFESGCDSRLPILLKTDVARCIHSMRPWTSSFQPLYICTVPLHLESPYKSWTQPYNLQYTTKATINRQLSIIIWRASSQ